MVKEAISQIGQRIKNCKCMQNFCFLCSREESSVAVKMPWIHLIFGPFSVILDNLKTFFMIGGAYALAQTLLSLILGFAYICLYGVEDSGLIYCSASNGMYLVYSILKFCLVAMFLIVWGQTIFGNRPLSIRTMFLPQREIPSVLLTLAVFLVLNIFPMFSYYILYMRVPNPDWIVEVCFFGIVSIGFFVPFWLMKFYSVLAFIISGEKLFPFKVIWEKNSGNMLKIILSVFLMLLLVIFVMVNFFINFKDSAMENTGYVGVVSEVLYNFFSLLIFSIFVNHCFIQKEILFGGNQDESESNN